jgi:hypothetical protein
VNSIFLLRAFAAQKMLQVPNHLRCYAAKKPAIHAGRSETNPASSQIADFVALNGIHLSVRFEDLGVSEPALFSLL